MRRRLEKGFPQARGTKGGGEATWAAEARGGPRTGSRPEPGYRVGEGPAQSSPGSRAGVGPTGSGGRLPTSLTARARGPEDWLGEGGRP